jgi:hypothetical protein
MIPIIIIGVAAYFLLAGKMFKETHSGRGRYQAIYGVGL